MLISSLPTSYENLEISFPLKEDLLIYLFRVYKCFSECIDVHYVYVIPKEDRRGHCIYLELELQMVVSHHVDVKN